MGIFSVYRTAREDACNGDGQWVGSQRGLAETRPAGAGERWYEHGQPHIFGAAKLVKQKLKLYRTPKGLNARNCRVEMTRAGPARDAVLVL
jgi:hypothetical protein